VVRPAERQFHIEHPHVHTEELEVIADGVAA